MRTKLQILLLAVVALALPARAAVTNTVGVAWNPVAGTNVQYKLWIGTNSGAYQLSFTYTATNAWLDPKLLFLGTNFVAVTAVQNVNSNLALISTYSAEVLIVLIPPPQPLQITVTDPFLTSSNLVAWTVLSNTVLTLAVTPKQPQQFYRPNPCATLAMSTTPDAVAILPTPPRPTQ